MITRNPEVIRASTLEDSPYLLHGLRSTLVGPPAVITRNPQVIRAITLEDSPYLLRGLRSTLVGHL